MQAICKLEGCDNIFEKIVHNKLYCCTEHKDKGRNINYYLNNREKEIERTKKYYKENYYKNRDEIIKKNLEYTLKNKDKVASYMKSYAINNRNKINDRVKIRMSNDVLYKLSYNIRSLISISFKLNNYSKNSKTNDILGCSFEEFKKYLESKFEPWMTWENRGLYNGELNYGWDIDHIIPTSSAKNIDELIKLNHYTNLQPLCSYKNRVIKRNKLQWQGL